MIRLNDGGPAFPADSFAAQHAPGMSLRDWFAGQFYCGAVARSDSEALNVPDDASRSEIDAALHEHWAAVAHAAYIAADAMLSERAKSLNTSSEKDAG
jgi:hypothetical protein